MLFLPCKQQADATYWINNDSDYRCFYLANSRQMQRAAISGANNDCCFYLANSRQMQHKIMTQIATTSCFYLANSRQMQQSSKSAKIYPVVFTLQTAGRCNGKENSEIWLELFLPCKQQADATLYMTTRFMFPLFLPCKQQADATI